MKGPRRWPGAGWSLDIPGLPIGGGARYNKKARVASARDLAVGASKLFEYAGDRWLLVRLGEDRFVAVGQKCTHLGCPVLWKAGTRKFHCPCHEGWFDEEGKVLAGPPPRPLPRLEIRRDGDELWASATTS